MKTNKLTAIFQVILFLRRFFSLSSNSEIQQLTGYDKLLKIVSYDFNVAILEEAELSEEDVFHAGFTFEELEAFVHAKSEDEYKAMVDKVVGTQLEKSFYPIKKNEINELEEEFQKYVNNQ